MKKETFVVGLMVSLFTLMIISQWNVDRKAKYKVDPIMVIKNLHKPNPKFQKM